MRKKLLSKNNFPLFLVPMMGLFAVGFFALRDHAAKPAVAAARAEIVKTSYEQQLQKYSLTGFDDKGKKFWNLEGETAKIDLGETVFLEDNVTLKLRDNTIVKTDHVQWSQDRGTLRTQAPVFVTRDNTRIKGMGALGKLNESFIQLNRDIEMVLNERAKLTCIGPMKIFYNDNKMTFYRIVKVADEKGTLTANRMDVYFDPEDKRIKEIVAVGNVVIHRGTDTTRSQRAIYTPSNGSVRLEGSPEITLHKESSEFIHAPARN